MDDVDDVTTNTMYIESYKMQLNQLNSLLSPKKLFNEIDALFKPYQDIKRYIINQIQNNLLSKHQFACCDNKPRH